MKQWQVTLVVCSVIGLVVVALFIMWVADTTPIHFVKDEGGILYVTLQRHGAIVDVTITPSKERVHLDVHYNGGVMRHIDVETHGKPVLISPIRIKITSISKDFFTDQLETRWHWKGGTFLPHPGQRLYGAIGYVPATNTCTFLEQANDDGPLQGRWEREQ